MRKLKLLLCSFVFLSLPKAFAQLTTGDFFLDAWVKSEYKIYYMVHNFETPTEWRGSLVTLYDINAIDFEIYGPDGYKKFYGRLSNPSKEKVDGEKHIQEFIWECKNRRGFASIIWGDNPDLYKVMSLAIGDDSYIFTYK